MPRFLLLVASVAAVLSSPAWVSAEDLPVPAPLAPKIAPASDDATKAMAGFRRPMDLQVRLFAAEPDVANPVAFAFDHRGRLFVCETFRQGKGVEDNRGHGHWLDDDLAAQTVEDRLAYFQKHLKANLGDYSKQDDRLRLLEDTDGDGRADKSTVFADRFNHPLDGTGSGVLIRGGDVFYACIPHLWRLRDTNADGVADERQSLQRGYGVRVAFRGHDSHGFCLGPDGKLYFSIGDRGLNVPLADGRRLVNPESGAVLRCNLDGSGLELFATGLRNPQELAFDDFGNLFTGDNNSDSGDRARWTYVVEGADIGWRMAYQYLPDRGPFNREKIWHPFHADHPAHLVPPIVNLASGPSGLAYYPGTGLSDHYKGRFFLCDFRGQPGGSTIHTFRVRPKGAFFEIADHEEPIGNILATDVDFGPDGAIYVSDWVNGWNGEGKGRIYAFYDASQADSPLVKEVKTLLAGDWSQHSPEALGKLLAHADRRVRQEAQFALAARKEVAVLTAAARENKNRLARLHGLWGLGQTGQYAVAADLLTDTDAEVRAQAAKVVGDGQHASAFDGLVARLKDENLRVRFFAAQSLGKLGRREAIEPLLTLLADNDNQDPIVRHGGVMGLAGTKDAAALVAAANHHSAAARLGVLLALRRKQSAEVARFLGDTDPRVVLEAARAIHDEPIGDALPQLAAIAGRSTTSDPLLRRVLNANYRLGQADAIAAVAARSETPDAMRIEALEMLSKWSAPSSRDRVLGMWRPIAARSDEPARAALRSVLPKVLTASSAVQNVATRVAAQFGIKEVAPALRELLADKTQPATARADALDALAVLKDAQFETLLTSSLTDDKGAVRASARRLLARRQPAEALKLLEPAIYAGEQAERQAALSTLAEMTELGTNAVIGRALDKLAAGELPAELHLDVLQAGRRRAAPAIRKQLDQHEASKSADDPLAKHRETLVGGDAERGRRLFFERTELSCVRCHKVGGVGGDVGPDLSKIAVEKKRDYLLESLVLPSKTIAKNFETALLVLDSGQVVSGIVRGEDDKQVKLITPEGKLVTVDKSTIEDRKAGKSAMPEDLLKHLTPPDLRDLIEFLASCK